MAKVDNYTFTSESVCSGHPDKICDQISDAIVDAVLEKDKDGRVAVEALVTRDRVIIAGEITCKTKVNFESIAKNLIKNLGYNSPDLGFSDKSKVDIYIHEQSGEIAKGVDKKGAGDQGMMFGFACKDTKNLMPLPIILAHALTQAIDRAREKKVLPFLKPDGKSQVCVEYKKGKPVRVTSVVIAVPHSSKVSLEQVKEQLYKKVVTPVLVSFGYDISKKEFVVNGTGVWHHGGPAYDTGVTGRKIIVDTYGGYARVGGGCFSGKDPTKVDRSAAYAARFIAKNIVAQKLAEKAEVRIAYFIGAKKPLMQQVETFGTSLVSNKVLLDFIKKLIDTSVEGILDKLKLKQPIYLPTSCYGHFGREGFTWEEIV